MIPLQPSIGRCGMPQHQIDSKASAMHDEPLILLRL
jgi:hypothetical protein